MQHIQRPTCVNVRIRSTQDAHKIFYAVQRGILQMVTRRLDADERLALRSGCIYAWEERGPHTEITGLGIERFTEGRRWSPSRVRDEFLFYYEKYSPTTDGNQRPSDSKVPPRDWDPLVKQTYSVYVDTTKGRRKWHLTAYFTQATVDQLGTVDDIDGVGNLDVPDGLFKSTRVGKGRKNDEASGRVGESSTAAASTATRTPPGSQSLHMYQPYPNAHYPSSYYAPSEYSPSASPHQRAPPPLSSAPSYMNESAARLPPPAAPTSHYEYNRPPTLSNRAWSPPPISAPRSVESPFYGSAAPSPAPYSPAASYRSPPPSQSSHIPSQQQHSSRHSNASSHSHSPPPNWSDEGINRYPSVEVHRADLRPSMPQRPYDSPYTYVPPAPPSVNVSISRPRSPQYPSPTTHTHSHSHTHSHTHSHAPYSVPHIPPIVPPSNHNHHNNHHHNPTHTHTYNNDRMDNSYEPSSPTSSMDSDERRGANGPCRRVDLAPLYALQRSHPYRRDPVDDRTLRLLGPRSS